jgi:hypothetical protein
LRFPFPDLLTNPQGQNPPDLSRHADSLVLAPVSLKEKLMVLVYFKS